VITSRIAARIEEQYGDDASSVCVLLEEAEVRVFHEAAIERITAAVVILAGGSVDKLLDAIRLMEADWRDLLVASGLAHADWPSDLDDIFGAR
jgi:triosephosphate isomerase